MRGYPQEFQKPYFMPHLIQLLLKAYRHARLQFPYFLDYMKKNIHRSVNIKSQVLGTNSIKFLPHCVH